MKQHLLLPLLFSFVNIQAQMEWYPLADGLNGGVIVLKEHNGNIYAGGAFTDAGGDPDADYLARWDGIQWHAVAPGLTDGIQTMAFQDTSILVGGFFTDAGGNPDADYIAYWDGHNWNALGQGLNGYVLTIATNGNLIYAGGGFTNAGGNQNADIIAYWNGNDWNALGSGLNSTVHTIAIDESNVYVGGLFTNAGGNQNADGIAYWNGSTWNAMGGGLPNQVLSIIIDEGEIYAAGLLIVGDVAKWDGSQWQFYPDLLLNDWINSIAITGETIYAAAFSDGLYFWDGNVWSLILETEFPGSGDEVIYDVIIKDDELYAGGIYDMEIPGVHNIAKWVESPLAIDLLSFKAFFDHQLNKVKLEWITANETNTDHFTIERSTDAILFKAVDSIVANGTSQNEQHYISFDQNPHPGINYYRLCESDKNGVVTYSSIAVVKVTPKNGEMICYPNPIKDKLILSMPGIESSVINVLVYNTFHLVEYFTFESITDNITIDLSSYPCGVYFIDAEAEGRHVIKKIIKE